MIPPALFAAILGATIFGGLALAIDSLRRHEPRPPAPRRPGPGHHMARLLGVAGSDPGAVRTRRALLVAAVTGLAVGILTGWYIAIVVLPALVIGWPMLIGKTSTSEIDKLADLDAWVRSLAGILVGGGVGLEQGLRISLSSAPSSIRPALGRLVARLDAQQSIEPALRLWADEMDDHTADLVAAALILESRRREGGIADALDELADNVSMQTQTRREIEADRATHRSTARWVSIISMAVIAVMVVTGTYTEPYKTPLGQLVALALLGAYSGCLLWMRNISIGRPIPRFLPATSEG